MIALLLAASAAFAQSAVPDRQVPPSVLAEVRLLEGRFDAALAADCDPVRCFSKGCAYIAHAVVDRPPSTSLPGLGEEAGPGSGPPQEYLTRATCSFAHEQSVSADDVQVLVRRLQTKLTGGVTSVSIGHQALQPLPRYLQEPPAAEPEPEADTVAPPAEAAPPPPAEPWSATAGEELWTALLPHLPWMFGVVLVTLAATGMIWAWRRVGRESLHERLLLSQLDPADGEATPAGPDADAAFVAEQEAAWAARLGALDPEAPDPELQTLIRELLRAGELPLLAKAMFRFPESFRAMFPTGGDVALAKVELAEFLKTATAEELPGDAAFFRALHRHSLSAAVVAQSDAQIVRSLSEDFGGAGLAALIGRLPERTGAVLFALAPGDVQREVVRLVPESRLVDLSEQLLRSNRMDPGESTFLFAVLRAARAGASLPTIPPLTDVSDRGATFDAPGALSVLLPELEPPTRAALFRRALERFHGNFPGWYREIFYADLLATLDDEGRADLLLAIDPDALVAWFSLQGAAVKDRLVQGAPTALRATLQGAAPPRSRLIGLAGRANRELAARFHRQLAALDLPFERAVGAPL